MSDTEPLVIGIDAGTSVVKAVAFTLDGRQAGVHAVRNRYRRVEGGGVEQNMDETWADTAASLKGLAASVPGLARRAVAAAVTAQGDGTWLIDRDGRPVGDAFLWLDARAGDLVAGLRADHDRLRAIYARTGTGPNVCQSSAHLLWMQLNAPERLERAAAAFHCKDWLYFRLTGTVATDPSEGTFTFGDFPTRTYSDEVIEAFGLEGCRRLLPPMLDGAQEAGRLSPAAAAETGLPAGLPVVLGYVDMVCTGLGGGLYERSGSTGCSVVGSTAVHMKLAESPEAVELNPDCTGYCMALPAPGAFAQMQSSMAATINLDWLAGLAAEVLEAAGAPCDRGGIVRGFDALAAGARPARLLYHPYISSAGERGPFVDPRASASFMGLSDDVTYADMVRATLEGLAYAGRDCYAAMGAMPAEVRLTGGAGRSATMGRILASVFGAPVRASAREEAGAAGAAMIAMVALGHHATLGDCAQAWVEPTLGEAVTPDPALTPLYDRGFGAYRAARQALQPVWAGLRGLQDHTT